MRMKKKMKKKTHTSALLLSGNLRGCRPLIVTLPTRQLHHYINVASSRDSSLGRALRKGGDAIPPVPFLGQQLPKIVRDPVPGIHGRVSEAGIAQRVLSEPLVRPPDAPEIFIALYHKRQGAKKGRERIRRSCIVSTVVGSDRFPLQIKRMRSGYEMEIPSK
jgi:hypothetical protein